MVKRNGQSLIEVVVSVEILLLVLAGVVVIVGQSLALRTKSLERKKASEVAEKVMEELSSLKSEDEFWNLTTYATKTEMKGFPGMYFWVDYTVVRPDAYPGCNETAQINCVEAKISVSFGNNQVATFNRFFKK